VSQLYLRVAARVSTRLLKTRRRKHLSVHRQRRAGRALTLAEPLAQKTGPKVVAERSGFTSTYNTQGKMLPIEVT
jgi:hypothetical protein